MMKCNLCPKQRQEFSRSPTLGRKYHYSTGKIKTKCWQNALKLPYKAILAILLAFRLNFSGGIIVFSTQCELSMRGRCCLPLLTQERARWLVIKFCQASRSVRSVRTKSHWLLQNRFRTRTTHVQTSRSTIYFFSLYLSLRHTSENAPWGLGRRLPKIQQFRLYSIWK